MNELWKGIEEVYASSMPFIKKYRYYYDTLHRVCIQLTATSPTQYSDLFSRLQAVCRITHYPLHAIDTFRWRAHQVVRHNVTVDERTYMLDVRTFVDAIAHFSRTPCPPTFLTLLPDAVTDQPQHTDRIEWMHRQRRMRFTVVKVGEPLIECISNETPSDKPFLVDVTMNAHTMETAHRLKVGMRINALSYNVDKDNIFHPRLIIIEPDYLVDITTITGCVKAYGDSAFNHLISKLQPNDSTIYTLLGDFANQFLDDAFNHPETDYNTSMHKAFSDRAISICACPDIDNSFFEKTRQQFANIHKAVDDVLNLPYVKNHIGNIRLEPSYFCEALGIQGRFDCLIDLDDSKKKYLIELKSGKWDEYANRTREEHTMQMLLYKEVLFYNLGIPQSNVYGNLLYSRYPKLQEQRSVTDIVHHALNIRNAIVCMELGLASGMLRKWLPMLTPDALLKRSNKCSNTFWTRYCLPSITAVTTPLHNMDALTAEYFHTFMQFIEREQIESKMSDTAPGSDRTMSSLWNTDIDSKLQNGDILINLSPLPTDNTDEGVIKFQLPTDNNALLSCSPNIRIGDAVILYRRNSDTDTATTQEVIRCNVESLEDNCLTLKMRNPQDNPCTPTHAHSNKTTTEHNLYAVEHDHTDSSFRALYSNLFSLVVAHKSRRDLLLCQRQPQTDISLTLTKHYTNDDIDRIVLKAKQARDMFLLMGPPGTGKTNVALKAIVEEHLTTGTILLLAYTNRAVDEICEMLSTIHTDKGDKLPYIRLGRTLSCAPQHRDHIMANTLGKLNNRKQVIEQIEATQVFVSTVASMATHTALLAIKHFNVAIFDEASQILEPHILGLLTSTAIDKFIMIGDHKQLPAVVIQSEQNSAVHSPILHAIGLTNCRNSLFQRLFDIHGTNPSVAAMLHSQGRMHPDICSFPSQAFYEGKLKAVGLPHQTEPLPYTVYDKTNTYQQLIATTRIAFIDVPIPRIEERQPKINVDEAKTIAHIVENIVRLHADNNLPLDIETQVGVIVPFRRQIALVHAEIDQLLGTPCHLVVDTVERYQGSQRDFIIYGTTITQPHELDILSNITSTPTGDIDRKLNVALTRARKQLFVIGNAKLLSRNHLYAELIDSCKQHICP